jgi:succinate dehydrogenase / fumarate reductase cytochrome b subunit
MQNVENSNPVAHLDGATSRRTVVAGNRVMALWDTMIGKKVVMAPTGVVLLSFVIGHMLGTEIQLAAFNLQLSTRNF